MKRDLLFLQAQNLVIATDNCGSVGNKQYDTIKSSNFIVAYYSCRVVLLELMSVKSKPIAYSFQVFDTNTEEYLKGIKQALSEVGYQDIPYIFTTESNFSMQESGFSLTIIGEGYQVANFECNNYGVLGIPLVGDEVLVDEEVIITLDKFKELVDDTNICEILPVGSRGIKVEFEGYFEKILQGCRLDVEKSAGPATCVIIAYYDKNLVTSRYPNLFSEITWSKQ